MSAPSPTHIRHEPEGPHTWVCLCGNKQSTGGFESCDLTGKPMEPIEGWPELYVCSTCNRIIKHGTREIVGRRKLYNHAFTIGFSFESTDPTGENVPASALRAALKRRIRETGDEELPEAVGMPFDTYEVSQ